MSIDLETRAADDSSTVDYLKLWLRLSACTHLVRNELRTRLRTHFDTTLPRFDLLAQLASNPDGLRMGELSQRLMVSNGNVTSIANQLEHEGLILKRTDKSDRRTTYLVLTPNGKKFFQKINKSYQDWVEEMFGRLKVRSCTRSYNSLAEVKNALHTAIESSKRQDPHS